LILLLRRSNISTSNGTQEFIAVMHFKRTSEEREQNNE
jgi:hypothetical protein